MVTSSRIGFFLSTALCFAPFAEGFSSTFPSNPSAGSGVVGALGMGSPQPVLMDPKRFQMRQSVSFSAASGGGSTLSQSFYQNSMTMRLAEPLTLHLDLGILSPLSASGPAAAGLQRGAYLVPSLGLEYRPSESTLLTLQYTSLPSAPIGSKGGLPWR
jgi:hypothetical protein